jgi:hypothetical protein
MTEAAGQPAHRMLSARRALDLSMLRRLALALFSAAALAAAAAPGAGAAQSANVKLLANVPEMASAISVNFIGDTMFVSTVAGIYAYSVADPSAPALIGALPMYIWENEDVDVDVKRKRLFISRDPRGFTSPAVPGAVFPYGAVHIIDVSSPHTMTQIGFFLVPAGHTTTCVNDCDVIWTGGPVANTATNPGFTGRPIYATDVTDPASPKACPAPIDTGRNDGVTDYAHDVQVDGDGIAWVSGAGGVRGYWTRGTHRDPVTGETRQATGCKPIPYGGSGTADSATPSRFMHNAWRDAVARKPAPAPKVKITTKRKCKKVKGRKRCRKVKVKKLIPVPASGIDRADVLLATEENVVTDCKTAGRFVTYDLRSTLDGEGFKDIAKTKHRMKALDTWTPEKQEGASGCASSHYFSSRGDGLTANAFYEQGVRFLDSSDPSDIRQVGFFLGDGANTWAAYWHKGVVFVADFGRGIDVLEFTGGPASKTVRAPALRRRQPLAFAPSSFAGLCPLPRR